MVELLPLFEPERPEVDELDEDELEPDERPEEVLVLVPVLDERPELVVPELRVVVVVRPEASVV